KFKDEKVYKVKKVLNEDCVELENGLVVKLLGIKVLPEKRLNAKEYLENFVKGKEVFLKTDPNYKSEDLLLAYLFLKNKIFINKEMIRQGFAVVEEGDFIYKNRLLKVQEVIKNA
ncbi:MAG: thermonuclease family protein, partial [Archaeoglobaceae archaeon]|nr:thermonuclease family protein [Archaeoglobaceae archaeon]MDW8128540.1 thermonuclease family protein [Archaeoglobaceae archaeon]